MSATFHICHSLITPLPILQLIGISPQQCASPQVPLMALLHVHVVKHKLIRFNGHHCALTHSPVTVLLRIFLFILCVDVSHFLIRKVARHMRISSEHESLALSMGQNHAIGFLVAEIPHSCRFSGAWSVATHSG